MALYSDHVGSGEDHVDAHTFRVLAPSLVPSVHRSHGGGVRANTGIGEDTVVEAEISRLRKELHLDVGARSPVVPDLEETFGRYARRAESVRSRPRSRDPTGQKSDASPGHPRQRLTRAAALGTEMPFSDDDVRRLTATVVDAERRKADDRVSAAVAEVRRDAEKHLAQMRAQFETRAHEMAEQMATAHLNRARAEAVEQLRAELKARDISMRRSPTTPSLRLIRAFKGWRSSAYLQAEYNARLRRLMCHFSHFSLLTALRGWKAGIAWYRRARGLLNRAGRRMRSLRVSRAWMKWWHHTRSMRVGRRALVRLVHAKLSRAFERWQRLLEMRIGTRLQAGEIILLEAKRVNEKRRWHSRCCILVHTRSLSSTTLLDKWSLNRWVCAVGRRATSAQCNAAVAA